MESRDFRRRIIAGLRRAGAKALWLFAAAGLVLSPGCAAPGRSVDQAETAAYQIIAAGQQAALGRQEPFAVERPSEMLRRRILQEQNLPYSHPASLGREYLAPPAAWPDIEYPRPREEKEPSLPWPGEGPLVLSLVEALQLGARSNSDYQAAKEEIFRAALALDFQQQEFRHSLAGLLRGRASADLRSGRIGLENRDALTLEKRLLTGLTITTRLGLDLVRLLTFDRSSSLGVFADATLTLPLLRGSGREVVSEPLTQAEREVIYAIYRFERFRQNFAVEVASDYLAVLRLLDEVANSRENHEILLANGRRAQRLAEAGRLPEIQVDQALQESLRARDRLLRAIQNYERQLDRFKLRLNLPTDGRIELDAGELHRLADGGPISVPPAGDTDAVGPADGRAGFPPRPGDLPEGLVGSRPVEEQEALGLALERRADLLVHQGRVHDAQRRVVVAADSLRSRLDLTGSGSVGEARSPGSAALPHAELRPERGSYAALLNLEWPASRIAERNLLRTSLLNLDRAVRDLQHAEDLVKLEVRKSLRDLAGSRERIRIQAGAVEVAQRRVDGTGLLLQAGRVQMRDLLEAREALVVAQNSLTAARVDSRIAELALLRDLGVLEVGKPEDGRWKREDGGPVGSG